MIPTYNESKNIREIIENILNLNISGLEIVVVDDDSPDKTWKLVLERSKEDKRIHLLHRKNKKGRGYAGIAGFKYALSQDADFIIEMDADFSHDPKYIPELLKQAEKYDLVLGSRFIKGGKDSDRARSRRLTTILAVLYIQLIMGLRIKDPNSGYRCFKRKALASIVNSLVSKDADIVQEVLYKIYVRRYKIKEIPIIFKDRIRGKTTKTFRDFIKGLLIVLKWRFLHLIGKI